MGVLRGPVQSLEPGSAQVTGRYGADGDGRGTELRGCGDGKVMAGESPNVVSVMNLWQFSERSSLPRQSVSTEGLATAMLVVGCVSGGGKASSSAVHQTANFKGGKAFVRGDLSDTPTRGRVLKYPAPRE